MEDLNTAIQNAGSFYIHYNKMNIGSRGGSSSLSQSFSEQKQIIAA